MRIGVLNLTRFGDLVQTSPMLSGLRRRHPDARIDLIIKSRFVEAARMLREPDSIVEIDGDALARKLAEPSSTFLDAFRAVPAVSPTISPPAPYDVVYNLTHSRASAVLLSLMQARRRVGFDIGPTGSAPGGHALAPAHGHGRARARRLNRINLVDIYLGAANLVGLGERLHVDDPGPGAQACARAPGRRRAAARGPARRELRHQDLGRRGLRRDAGRAGRAGFPGCASSWWA